MSRRLIFVKWLAVIPHLIALYLLLVAAQILTVLAWFAILFTGRYPRAFFPFTSGVLRWASNAMAYASLLRDEYPPFGWEPGEYPLELDIPYADRQSRRRLFVRGAAILPNIVVFWFVQIAWFVTTVIAWFAVLFTARYPRGLFRFSAGVMRWYNRQAAYLFLLRDEYPPYSVNADARPGNEALSALIGMPMFALYILASVAPALGFLLGGDATTRVDAAMLDNPAALERERPSASANNVRITLEGYDDDALPPPGADTTFERGMRFVSFDVLAEKTGRMPAMYLAYLFALESCDGGAFSVDVGATNEGGDVIDVWWTGGSAHTTAYFQVPEIAEVCELTYRTGVGAIRFVFE